MPSSEPIMPSFDPTLSMSELVFLTWQKYRVTHAMPDFEDRLTLHVRDLLQGDLQAKLFELRSGVYRENLPPEQATETKTIHWSRNVTVFTHVLDGPWQRWKKRHCQRWWWPRWLLGWPRHIKVEFATKVEGSEEVTLVVQLRRFLTYPESALGPPRNEMGTVVVRGHEPPLLSWIQKPR